MKTIGVVSFKGGVGKTSSVVALGSSFKKLGKKVLLVDGDFSSPNLGVHFNILDPEKNLTNVLLGKLNIKDAIHSFDGVDVLPASLFNRHRLPVFKLKEKLRPLKEEYDLILIDSPPSLNEDALSVLNSSDSLIVVATPDYPTIASTLFSVKLARQKGIPIEGIILNKVHNKNFEVSIPDIEKTFELPVMALIPYDVNILKSLSEFIPFTDKKPNSSGAVEFRKLAATLLGEKLNPSFNLLRLFKKITPSKTEVNREIYYTSVFK